MNLIMLLILNEFFWSYKWIKYVGLCLLVRGKFRLGFCELVGILLLLVVLLGLVFLVFIVEGLLLMFRVKINF